ncbi:MAG: hypothetical protein AB7N76_22455 [Planctomycetota bacterium]
MDPVEASTPEEPSERVSAAASGEVSVAREISPEEPGAPTFRPPLLESPGEGRALLAIAAVALLLRLARAALREDAWGGELHGDAAYYAEWAAAISRGEGRAHAFFADPLFAYLRAALPGLGPLLALWALLDALRCALAYALTRLALGPGSRAPLVAAAIVALYEPYALYAGLPLKTTLAGALLDGALLAGLVALERRSLAAAAGFGLVLGLAGLGRSNFLLLGPAFALACALQREQPWRQRLARVALAGALAFAAISPATLHNLARGDWVLTTANYGHLSYLGNNPENRRSGLPLHPPWLQGNPSTEEEEWSAEAARRLGHPVSPREREAYWAAQARAEVRGHPGDALWRAGHRALLLVNAFEVPDNYDLYFERDLLPRALCGPLPLLGFGLIAPLAALGLWTRRRAPGARWLALAALAVGASLLPFGVYGRYRLPLVATLIPFAAAGALDLLAALRARRRAALGPLALVGAAAALVHLPLLDADLPIYLARDHYGVALAQGRAGRPERALAAARRALSLDPSLVQARLEEGVALARLGRDQEALAAYLEAARGPRRDVAGLALFDAGALLLRRGEAARARDCFRQAAPLLDWNPDAQRRARELAGAPSR